MAIMLAICARLSGRLVGSRGPRLPLVLAGPAIAAAAILLSRLTLYTPVAYLVAAYVIFGIGSGLVTAPITNTAVSGMPAEQAGVAGVAGAIASTSRQVGAALGVAVTGSLVAAGTGAGFITASHAAWAVIAGCGVAVLALGLVSTGKWAVGTAQRNGERLARSAEEVPDGHGVPAAG
jgi:MFS family permease